MSQTVTIALDAMGGDAGPEVVIGGAAIAVDRRPDLRFVIFGEEDSVRPALDASPRVRKVSEFHHCGVTVQMHDKPSQALRKGRWKSSMWRTIEAVRDHEAGAAVSAGNTGALMAMAKFCLKPLPGIERPAIAAIWPTLRGESIVLDVGATVGADAGMLVDFAVMGAAMARSIFGLDRPTVGLLNVGVEEIKGIEQVREASRILREMDHPGFEYRGYVEGDDLGRGTVDVAVTEGFSGNIAIKTAEGTAKQIGEYLRAAMARTWAARLGYLFAQSAFRLLREKMDPRKVNGGVFLGLNGVVIKSHGGTDAEGFASAVELAREMARADLIRVIAEDLAFNAEKAAGRIAAASA
ncbi:MAG: phosphate acyltransferase PlsX [Propylenella sp.]